MPDPNASTESVVNPLEMSDEDFLNSMPPSANGTVETVKEEKKPEGEDTQTGAEGAAGDDTLKGDEDTAGGESKSNDALKDEPKEDAKTADEKSKGEATSKEPEKPSGKAAASADSSKPDGKAAAAEDQGTDSPATAQSMADFYRQVVETPIKANGKTIKINSAAEAIGLMQMGANYTRKLQELAPARKVIAMLDKNGLLDESKITFLIDIAQKNPDAIKKLVKESGVDPMEIDTTAKDTYIPGNHQVSDTEVRFQTSLTGLKSSEEGRKTLQVIHTTWDDASKDALWVEPEVMDAIHEQIGSGVYKTISDEVERQKAVGLIPVEAPFLQAYKFVGEMLTKQATAARAASAPKDTLKPEPKIVATRTPPAKVDPNGDKAKAAAGTKGAPGSAKPFVNPFAMADDEFMKQMANRL